MGRLSGSNTSSTTTKKRGRLASPSSDLSGISGLQMTAEQAGLGAQARQIVQPEPRLSFLQRLSRGLGAFNPAEAILTGMEEGGFGAGLKEYGKNVVQGIASSVTGVDYENERRSFSDVAEKYGVENGIARFGLGLAGDILLDPSTYFGGALIKGMLKLATTGSNIGVKAIGRLAPETERGLRIASEGVKDAFGRAFKYGYRTSEGAAQDVLTFLSKEERAKLGLATSNLNRLGTGVLTKNQQEELAVNLISGKRAEFEAREQGLKIANEVNKKLNRPLGENEGLDKDTISAVLKEAGQAGREATFRNISDPTVKQVAEEQIERSKKIGETLGLENPYEVYFPFLKKDKLEGFLSQTSGIRVGSEGYRKQFKNLLTNENIELDPAKAFFTREAQIATDRMTADFLHGFVRRYGKKLDDFENSDEALKAGFHLVKDKGLFGKAVGYLNKYDTALLRDSLSPEFQTINMLAKASGFDALTSLFKRSVTGLFLPFHVRNFVSGQIQNFETLGPAALNPKNIAVGQKIAYLMGKDSKLPNNTIRISGKPMKFQQVMKPFVDRFSGDTFYNNDFLDAVKDGGALRQAEKTLSKSAARSTLGFQKGNALPLVGKDSVPMRTARAVGQFIEHQQKATAYITALDQGKSIKEALKIAEMAGFDYRALTRFESQILRRIIPFYSFTRKNIGLQLRTLGENPQRINQVLRFFENIGEPISGDEEQNLPDYLKESIGIKLPDTPDGLKQYISGFGTPIEQFASLFGKNPILRAISQTNPILKVPIELGIGKDSFRQRDLKEVYTADEYKAAPQILKDILEIKEVKKDTLKKDASGKLVKTGERSQFVADPIKLLVARSLFTSRGVTYLDQVFGEDMKGLVKLFKTTTGVRPTKPIDLEQLKSINETKVRRELEDLLTQYGVTRQFRTTYIPKE